MVKDQAGKLERFNMDTGGEINEQHFEFQLYSKAAGLRDRSTNLSRII